MCFNRPNAPPHFVSWRTRPRGAGSGSWDERPSWRVNTMVTCRCSLKKSYKPIQWNGHEMQPIPRTVVGCVIRYPSRPSARGWNDAPIVQDKLPGRSEPLAAGVHDAAVVHCCPVFQALVPTYPLVNSQVANLKMAIEIADLPIRHCDFP